VLALEAIRCDLQAELAVAPVALEPPPSTPASLMLRTSSTSGYHSSADACIVGRMQKAASPVDADTSFRAAARTSPGAISDLQRAGSATAMRPTAATKLIRSAQLRLPRNSGLSCALARCARSCECRGAFDVLPLSSRSESGCSVRS
jgi:hypothetical protein